MVRDGSISTERPLPLFVHFYIYVGPTITNGLYYSFRCYIFFYTIKVVYPCSWDTQVLFSDTGIFYRDPNFIDQKIFKYVPHEHLYFPGKFTFLVVFGSVYIIFHIQNDFHDILIR